MSSALYSDLTWLPPTPPDFRQRVRQLACSTEPGREAIRLSEHALDENQLRQLSNAITFLRKKGASLSPLAPFRLGVVGNGTLELLVPALVASAARYGVILECTIAEYGQIMQEAASPNSTINKARVDAVLIALDYRGLSLDSDLKSALPRVESAVGFIEALRAGFREHGAISIVQTIIPPPEMLFGSLDRAVEGTPRWQTVAFNSALTKQVQGGEDVLFDVAALAETVGLANWLSPVQWNVAKLPFDSRMLPLYADHVARIIGALRGKSRRCLILDLDNTVWGGIVGDDGIEGIVIGQGDATGEAYLDMQRFALALRERGVILAVSSKNDDAIARNVFALHPEMLLREHHLAVFQVNWDNKATNIAAIAEGLSLGLDSMVFVDDNPAERKLIRDMLPEVAVPELPEDPALYARTIAAAGYFETTSFSEEDRLRSVFYEQNAHGVSLQRHGADLDSYLRSLDMEISFRPFDALGRSRIAQLINKSNQFNLTTRRRTEAEVAELENDDRIFTLQVRLRDVFGDNGMIGVVVCKPTAPDTWEIDTWLMSCRVLGRGVECMVLRELLSHARERRINFLIGVYLPTTKNDLVRNHYRGLGFTLISGDGSGATKWQLDTQAEIDTAPMRVVRDGFRSYAGP
ncbi:MAG: haloacid dehalogenase [Candidatus Meridianibacter frigidus]|nr:MAG: haloacid dehalogenase [Candidatus Eremiobacteraeota bacterium]